MNKNKIKIAILAASSVLMISMTASAILGEIAEHYKDVDQSIIQMVLTLPSLVGMIFALVSGPLSLKISKKRIVLFGLVCTLIGGAGALLLGEKSIYILLLCSALIGVAQGINSTMTMALISDYFQGEECSSLMGLQSAFVNGGSMIILFTSGILAGIKWTYSYIVYLSFIPIILIVLKNLPNDPPIKENTVGKKKRSKLNKTVYFITIILFAYTLFSSVFQTNIAIYLKSNQLGEASTSGMVNSLMVGVGMVAGVLYGRIKKILKNNIVVVALSLATVGFFILYAFPFLPAVFISAALVGLGLSLLMPTAMFIVSNSVDSSMSATAIALTNAGSNMGMFLSPLLINPLSMVLGGGNETTKFVISAIALLVLVVISYGAKGLYTSKEA